ncbi:MAG: hypothetical protein ACUVQG_10605 [Thermogutta sp.]
MNVLGGLVVRSAAEQRPVCWHAQILTDSSDPHERRGFILLIVILGIISAMALTYVVASTSYVNLRKVRNTGLRDRAKASADTGLSVGLSWMCSSGWGGIGSTITRTCGENQAFEVSYEHGDPTLDPDSPEWPDLPYRVTIHAVGKAWHAGESDRPAVHRKSWVVRFVPRAVAAEPAGWSSILEYTFYQTLIADARVNIPAQVLGKCRFRGSLSIAPNYPSTSARQTYFSDLYAMKSNGYGEWRTFTGPLYLPIASQAYEDTFLLVNWLRVPLIDSYPWLPNNDIELQQDLVSYQLYPGGKTYQIPQLGASLGNTTLLPDVADNPAGIFYAPADITIGSNVIIRGSLFCKGKVHIEGTNIDIEGQPLRGIQSDVPVEMPALVCKKLEFSACSSCQIRGLLAIFGELKALKTATVTSIQITGRAFATTLKIDPLSPWESFDWKEALAQFQNENEEGTLTGEDRYFPLWLRRYGLDPTPRFMMRPPQDNPQYHWKRKNDPVYVAAASDTTSLDPQPGLRWEFLRELDGQ